MNFTEADLGCCAKMLTGVPRPAFKNNCVPVFLACDEKYFPYTITTIASIYENRSAANNYDVIVLASEIPASQLEQFNKWSYRKENFSIRFFDIKELVKTENCNFHVDAYISVAAYYRFYAPSIFVNYGKIIYLDSDLLVLCDLSPLYRIDMGCDLVAACIDFNASQNSLRNKVDYDYIENCLGVEPTKAYFNSGVLVFNLDLMRREEIERKLFDKLKELKSPRWHDQDVLNATLKGRVSYLDPQWNFHEWMADADEGNLLWLRSTPEFKTWVRSCRNGIAILHYLTAVKPWTWNYFGNCDNIFWAYARKTPFFQSMWRDMQRKRGLLRLVLQYLKTWLEIQKYRCFIFFSKEKQNRHRIKLLSKIRKKEGIKNRLMKIYSSS